MKSNTDDPNGDFRITLDYALTAVASWLIPGSGHWLLGYRLRGAILGIGILGLFWFGESALANNMAVSRETSPIFYGCQMGNGLSTMVSQQLWGKPHTPKEASRGGANYRPPDATIPRYYHFGMLFTTVSGLLNMLVVLHVLDPETWKQAKYDRLDRDRLPEESETSGGPSEQEGATT